MAKLEANVHVQLEKAVVDVMRDYAYEMANEHGLIIEDISFSWGPYFYGQSEPPRVKIQFTSK